MTASAPPARPTALRRPPLDLLTAMCTIRRFEAALLRLFAAGEVGGTTHTCLGQEHIPIAVSACLGDDDLVFSNHRGHGHYLARYEDPEGLLAEILGRSGAPCQGVGGSQHLYRPGFVSTGVQGAALPVAAGCAMHLQRRRPGALVVAYIGDGTWGEGAVYEALNLVALWSLPLLLVVEHNGIAQSTPTERQLAGTIAGRAAAFGIPHVRFEEVDVVAVLERLGPLVDGIRRTGRPLVAEFRVPRLGPHSKGDDTRTTDELAELSTRDWAVRYAAAFPELMAVADDRASQRIEAAVAEVRARPAATWSP